MKTLLIGSLVTLLLVSIAASSARAASNDCSITFKSKTLSTAGAKIGDVSFSKKQIEALQTICNVKRTTLSTDELIKLEEIAFRKRVNKLKGITTPKA